VTDSTKKVEILSQDKEILTTLKEGGASIAVSGQEFGLLSLERHKQKTTGLFINLVKEGQCNRG